MNVLRADRLQAYTSRFGFQDAQTPDSITRLEAEARLPLASTEQEC